MTGALALAASCSSIRDHRDIDPSAIMGYESRTSTEQSSADSTKSTLAEPAPQSTPAAMSASASPAPILPPEQSVTPTAQLQSVTKTATNTPVIITSVSTIESPSNITATSASSDGLLALRTELLQLAQHYQRLEQTLALLNNQQPITSTAQTPYDTKLSALESSVTALQQMQAQVPAQLHEIKKAYDGLAQSVQSIAADSTNTATILNAFEQKQYINDATLLLLRTHIDGMYAKIDTLATNVTTVADIKTRTASMEQRLNAIENKPQANSFGGHEQCVEKETYAIDLQKLHELYVQERNQREAVAATLTSQEKVVKNLESTLQKYKNAIPVTALEIGLYTGIIASVLGFGMYLANRKRESMLTQQTVAQDNTITELGKLVNDLRIKIYEQYNTIDAQVESTDKFIDTTNKVLEEYKKYVATLQTAVVPSTPASTSGVETVKAEKKSSPAPQPFKYLKGPVSVPDKFKPKA